MTFYEKPGGSPGYLIVILHLHLVTMETNASQKKKTAHWEKDHKRMEQEITEPQESGNPLREEGKIERICDFWKRRSFLQKLTTTTATDKAEFNIRLTLFIEMVVKGNVGISFWP
ncbi:hypothetical protein CEXT_304551 [Caerostris extrusa]|uniref:Uncharacterized protein n=1 Tax=Caerostris extrusa TaxID=172846 RepID=A0AAV4YDJ9_CAEEX|nr:hypothetical protein CEXT_304551 [Caerostris extrusa]